MPERTAPQVSIIVPVYNVEDYLRRCLNSIQAQTLADWECICVDDGSTDGSGAILDEYVAKDGRFVVIHQENGGTSRARNAGLAAARREYIGFVDHDDWIDAETYSLALDAARRTDADIVQWGYKYIKPSPQKKPAAKERSEGFFDIVQNPEYYSGLVWNKLFKASLAKKYSFPPAARMGGEDFCFSIPTYIDSKKCFYIDRTLYFHDSTHETLGSRKQTPDVILDLVEELKKVIGYAEQAIREQGNKGTQKCSLYYFA